MKQSMGIIGGDLRQRHLTDIVKMPIAFFANNSISENESCKKYNNLLELMENNEIILTPIPFSKDKINIYAKYTSEKLPIDYFVSSIKESHIILGGPFTEEQIELIENKGAKLIDITKLDAFKMNNAAPTTEGIISEIIRQSNITIDKSNTLILGYGFCGKRLIKILSYLGSKVDIYTENEIEKKVVIVNGYDLVDDCQHINKYDYVINTIPKKIITAYNMNKDGLFIDITYAYNFLDDSFIKMRGIPGNFSPKSAGEIIGNLLNNIIENLIGEKDN